MRKLRLVCGVLPLLLTGAAAYAHAFLDSASPPVGGTVQAAPAQITLTFSEGLEPHFSAADLQTANGGAVTAAASVDPGNDHQLVIKPQAALSPGTYRVIWHVVSVDTHKTAGNFTFTVTGP